MTENVNLDLLTIEELEPKVAPSGSVPITLD